MNNKLFISGVRLLIYCMIGCTSVIFLLLRLNYLYSPGFPFRMPDVISGPVWFTVLYSIPGIDLAIIILIICSVCFSREWKIIKSYDNFHE